jgi:hypothetical protein
MWQIRQIVGAYMIVGYEFPKLPELVASSNVLLFYVDADDWFAPDIHDRLDLPPVPAGTDKLSAGAPQRIRARSAGSLNVRVP